MAVLIFYIGAIMGSFYHCLGTRLPKGENVLVARSHCDKCKRELKWYNLIPLFSYIFQILHYYQFHYQFSRINHNKI